ncbi:hypothetical protein PR202_gb29290 [Eleusine coracana subsp. coracana]|uniref:Uncharacterized protein n=1 Tax=Eleusine coracana subsp. coracana TaxID=191504 RepID=A0AAV5G057_ELECO|nr:hypothetical protein PR202_gb29290 [Eleusine coracana subsp. coracana]
MRAHVVVSLLGEAGVPIQARRRLRPSPSSLFDEVLPSEAASPISLVVLVLIGGFSPAVAKIQAGAPPWRWPKSLAPSTSSLWLPVGGSILAAAHTYDGFCSLGRRCATHGELRLSLPAFPLF